MTNQFCLKCGARMVWQFLDSRHREVCPACGWIHYQHLKVSVAAQIETADGLLLLKRVQDPWKGSWNLPAGYVEVDEPPEMAVVREVCEETGLEVSAVDLIGNYYYQDDPRGNGLLLVFRTEIEPGRLRINHESQKAEYFPPNRLPENICGAGHRRAVQIWKLEKLNR